MVNARSNIINVRKFDLLRRDDAHDDSQHPRRLSGREQLANRDRPRDGANW